MIFNNIDHIILQQDNRGISLLQDHLPKDRCMAAAQSILNVKGVVFIVSGFYIAKASQPETDGPPGAIALGNALQNLGYQVKYVTDIFSVKLFTPFVSDADIIVFPIDTMQGSEAYAKKLLNQYNPVTVIAIERCGLTKEKVYKNMHGHDISAFNAIVDHLFINHENSIGIGDGGNEIGMGNVSVAIEKKLQVDPCVINTSHLIIASVSNWGSFGLITALSILSEKDLLVSADDYEQLITEMNKLGAVDGITLHANGCVDGINMAMNKTLLEQLRSLIKV